MNIILSGPFGLGSLSDEIVLAGVLKPLLAAKHHVTVLSADQAATAAAHPGVEVLALAAPTSMLSTPAVYKALDTAHFFGVCGAGVISDKCKVPARAWLGQLEFARQMKTITAVIGAGAIAIENRHEQARAQRLLHHFADGITVRDEAAKLTLIGYGMNANRISASGDPTLALFDEKAFRAAHIPAAGDGEAEVFQTPLAQKLRAAFFFTDGVPMRQSFAPDPTYAPASLSQALSTLLKTLNADGIDAVIFHDATRQNLKLAQAIADGAQSATLLGPDKPIAELSAAMASCSAAITDTLHGVLFAAAHAVPVVYMSSHEDVPPILEKLGLSSFLLEAPAGTFDPVRALELMRQVPVQAPDLRSTMIAAMSGLARKEALNARMIERLVPKRLRYPK